MELVHREVARFLLAHAVPRTSPALVAASGGADSVALLHALLAVGQRVAVAHVHHGLRGAEADADLAFVSELAHGLGVPFVFTRVDAAARDGRSPEARARGLRYEALERLRSTGGYAHVATAHHLDDQAETVLLRAVRGTGIGGLAAIRPSLDGGRVLRPLLALRRTDLRSYLDRRGLAFRQDASNADLSIPRNRLRADVLPALEAIHAGASARLAALAELALQFDGALIRELDQELAHAVESSDGGIWFEAEALLGLDVPHRRRALLWLAERAGLGGLVTRAHVERIEAFLLRAEPGRVLSLPGGFSLHRDRSRLWLGSGGGPRFPDRVHVELPREGALEFPERRLRLSWHACIAPEPPARLLRFPALPQDRLVARSPIPTDRIFMRGRQLRLKDVFASARWGRAAQARALIVERNGEIVWVPGLVRGESRGNDASSVELRAVLLPSPPRSC